MADEGGTRWERLAGRASGTDYAASFAALAAGGQDVHGEATFVASLVDAGARVLDAGCGTGRVGIRLAELGFDVVGVDADESMLAVARRERPDIAWLTGDLADLAPTGDVTGPTTGGASEVVALAPYDLVLLAGNVVPLLAPGTLVATVTGLAVLLRPGGLLVAGFGLDREHLPPGCPVTPLEEYDVAATGAGLVSVDRLGTWQATEYDPQQGYVVAVHRRHAPVASAHAPRRT